MKTQQEDQIIERLVQWIKTNSKIEKNFSTNDHLVNEGLITSLQIIELILFIETLKEQPIERNKITPKNFESIQSIYDNFFKKIG